MDARDPAMYALIDPIEVIRPDRFEGINVLEVVVADMIAVKKNGQSLHACRLIRNR